MNIPKDMTSGFKKESIDPRIISDYSGLAILVIDMQPTYVNKISDDALIQSQIETINHFSDTRALMINVEHAGWGKTIRPLHDELKKSYNLIDFQKTDFNAFGFGRYDPDDKYTFGCMHRLLRDMHINNIFLMGLYASECVFKTAMTAIGNGYFVSTADDVILDPSNRKHTITDKRRSEYIENKVSYYDSHHDFIRSLGD